MGAFRLCSVSAMHAVLEILGVCLTTAHGFNKREARRDRGHSEGPPGGQAQAWDKHSLCQKLESATGLGGPSSREACGPRTAGPRGSSWGRLSDCSRGTTEPGPAGAPAGPPLAHAACR